MYITDVWSVVYKIDVRSGTAGQIVWKMDPGVQKPDRNRGVALWGNLVISVAGLDGRVIATDKETGKIVWDKNLHDQPDMEITAAPLALNDTVIIGGSGGDNGVRCWLAALDAKTCLLYTSDDTTLQQLWKINVGTGFDAPPMTYSVDGKQYICLLYTSRCV